MEHYRKQAKLMRVLAHPVRLQILVILAQKRACVSDLIQLTGRRQANISQNLAHLKAAGFVSCSRQGRNVSYSLTIPCVIQLIEAASRYLDSGLPEERNEAGKSEYLGDTWYGIPREKIDWRPTVVVERCVGCGMCAISCRRDVYAFDYEQNRPVVVAPRRCTIGCTTCATICAQDAIKVPATGYLRQAIQQNKLLGESKDLLCAGRGKYDIKHCQVAAGQPIQK